MINRSKMRRQLYRGGGITRQRYGLGDFVRKLIPNEIADVAVKAAPFVAPFNPGIAGLMRGIGRYDQRGSLSDALKQGALTYGFGKGVGKLGGASGSELGNIFGRQEYTMKGFEDEGLGRLFDKQIPDRRQGEIISRGGKKLPTSNKRGGLGIVQEGVDFITSKAPILKKLPDNVAQKLLVGGAITGASALASYFKGDFRPQEEGESMEEYLAARKDVVGKQMRIYMDNYFKFDPEYSQLDDAGRNAFVARYNVAQGGRIGFDEGANTKFAMIKDMLAKGMDTDTIMSITGATQEEINSVKNERVEESQGGRIGQMRGTGPNGLPGIPRMAPDGMEFDMRKNGGFQPLGAKEKKDDVPAMLAKNEFVMTADAVRGAGNGDIELGAQKMYDTMKNLERRVT